jgi:hypothetical protein
LVRLQDAPGRHFEDRDRQGCCLDHPLQGSLDASGSAQGLGLTLKASSRKGQVHHTPTQPGLRLGPGMTGHPKPVTVGAQDRALEVMNPAEWQGIEPAGLAPKMPRLGRSQGFK